MLPGCTPYLSQWHFSTALMVDGREAKTWGASVANAALTVEAVHILRVGILKDASTAI